MLPRRCLPSWLGRWLRMNGGRNLAGAVLAVALPGRLMMVLPGGPARVLPRCAGFPGKDLAGGSCGFLRWGRLPSYPHLILIALCLHKDLHATTEVPPEPCPNATAQLQWAQRWLAQWVWTSCPGKDLAGAAGAALGKGPCQGNLHCPCNLCGLGPLLWFCSPCVFSFSPASPSCPAHVCHGRWL